MAIFEPGEIKSVMLAAADEMNYPISRLAHGQIAAGFGAAKAHDKWTSVHGFHFPTRSVVADQAKAGPGFAFVKGQSPKQSGDQTLFSRFVYDRHRFWIPSLAGKRGEED